MSEYTSHFVLLPPGCDWAWYEALREYVERFRVTVAQNPEDVVHAGADRQLITIVDVPAAWDREPGAWLHERHPEAGIDVLHVEHPGELRDLFHRRIAHNVRWGAPGEFTLCWPTDDTAEIAQRFGASPWIYRQWEGLPGHEGVDLRAAAGAPVYAGADGEVVAVDDAHPQSTLEYPYGCQVRIRHCCGQDVYHVIYGHLAEVAVHPGQWVSRGERIGATHEGDDDLGPAGCNLHLTLLREGARTDGYAPNLVDPELYLVRPDGWRPVADADLPTIYGTFRDENQEMARLMRGAGVNGYILWSEAVGSGGDVVRAGRDYVASTGAFGHTPIVRLSYGEEPDGALPTADGVGDFAARCADWVRQSQGCRVWIIGNEPNGPRAHPLDEPITAEQYAECFNRVYAAIKAVQPDAVVTLAPVDPDGAAMGDPLDYFRTVLERVEAVDAVALNAHTRGADPRYVMSDEKFTEPPLEWQFHHFRMFEPFIEAMPKSLQHLPVYLVAVHPSIKTGPDDSGWLDCNQGWVWTMYHAVDAWNRRGGQQVRCALLYRYPGTDEWALRRRTHVIEDFWQSLGMGYTPYLRPAEPVRATAGAAEMEAQCARAEAGVSVGLVRPGVGVWDDVPETAWLRSPDIPANMLTNGGFEADWNAGGDHQCLAVIDSATAEKRTVENIFTPPGWITWFRHAPGTWDQPEVRHIPVTGDARRVHSGQQSMLLFTFFRRHDAGFLQQAPAAPGAWMRLSAWAHAWSNHRLEGYETCEDDPYCSCGVGREAFAALVGTVPKPNGENSWVDAISNFTFQVGIDPTGGLNPLSDSVVWGQGMHIYNAYAPVPPVEVQAVNDTVTVFLRSTTLWGFKHCDAYWDDIELLPVGPQSSRPRVDLGYTPQAPTVGQTVTVEARASAPLSGVILEVRPPSGMPIRPTNLRVTPGAGCVVWTGTVSLEHAGTHELVFSADDGVWASTTFQCHVSTPAPRGAPRTQYRRTYVLLPPNAGEEWALAVVDGAWDAKRYTVGGSADDAGIGDLDVREVLAVNPVGWAGDLAQFFATHYPGVRYESITASSPDDLRSKLQARVGG